MAEWSIASVLKTEGLKGSVGSNPTPSANSMRVALLVWTATKWVTDKIPQPSPM